MIIKALTLENFKGIREPVRIEFAPLTLLFGPNNAGKSTIVQALMYAREVLERNNCDVGRTQMGGDVVDLGGFENLVYRHDLSRPVRVRFELDLRDAPSPLTSDWIREHEFENRTWDQYRDAPKQLQLDSAQTVWSRLQEVWVEIEIAWREARGPTRTSGPVIHRYSVGKGAESYAVISLDNDDREQSHLSRFNFGIYPFGTRYTKGDATDFEWDLQRIVRELIRNAIQQNDQPGLHLKKGASVTMEGEDIGTTDRRMPRKDFDELVYGVVKGEGEYGDSTPNEETGEQNSSYLFREYCIGLAKRRAEFRQSLATVDPFKISDSPILKKKFEKTITSEAAPREESQRDREDNNSEVEETSEEDGEPTTYWSEWANRRSFPHYKGIHETEEIDSEFLELFDALLTEEYVPIDSDYALPIKLSGTALPEWGKLLEFDADAWIPDRENEFWENPAFVEEYFKDLLTTLIVGPGEVLVSALKESVYVSPFREMPPRHYQPARSPEQRRWSNGLAAWDWLLLEDKSFAGRVNDWLTGKDRFNAGYAIDVRHYRELEIDDPVLAALTEREPGTDLDLKWVRQQLLKLPEGRRLKIKDLRSGVSLFPQDLGVGISQVIPVIVAALRNRAGVVAIEEPESNIHPAFQVVLADLFLAQAMANPQVLFLVETHSEHLMLRCLRRISETNESGVRDSDLSVWPKNIAVHFIEPSEHGPVIHRIRIDEDGEFMDPWPRGFFPERMKEVYGDDF